MTFLEPGKCGPRKEQKNGRSYRTFWLKVIAEAMVMTIKGCTYYIDTGTSKMPGLGGPFILFDPPTFKTIEKQARDTFIALGEPEPWVSEEERKAIQKEVRAKLKGADDTKQQYQAYVKKHGN